MLKSISAILLSTISIITIAQCDTLNYSSYDVTVCQGDTVSIPFIESPGLGQLFNFGNPVFLPDGSGQNYTTNINVAGFPAGLTLQNVGDLEKLCVSMEHSYIGDLEMMLTCPNGSSVMIFNAYTNNGLYPGGFGGGGTYLGGANDASSSIGVCEEYCFSDASTAMPAWINGYNQVPATGASIGNMVQPGTYNPEESFISQLIGCPLNGAWTLTVKDNIGSDDGWICDWSLQLGETTLVGQWNTSSGVSDSSLVNPVFYATQPNTFYYTTQDLFGGCQDTLTVNISTYDNLPPIVIAGSNSVNEFSTQTYSTHLDTNYTYNWNITNGVIFSGQGTNQIEVQWYGSPQGTLTVDIADNCNQATETLTVGIGYADINEQTASIIIYPNPSSDGVFHIKTQENIKDIEIRNILGQEVFSRTKISNDIVDISNLPKGNYILTFTTETGLTKHKINYTK